MTIHWIVPHIDGIRTVRRIVDVSKVDMEMVRNCLRVLEHHNILRYVDVFQYGNIYECTGLAEGLLSGKCGRTLLDEAVKFVMTSESEEELPSQDVSHTLTTMTKVTQSTSLPGPDTVSSLNIHIHSTPDQKLRQPKKQLDTAHTTVMLKNALAMFYCSCERNKSFGDILIEKVTESFATKSPTHHDIPWKDVFDRIDLHRFITFGVIYGLIRRIHEIPYVLDREFCPYTVEPTVTLEDALEDVTLDKPKQSNTRSKRSNNDHDLRLAFQIESDINGMKCDDELSCMYNMPLQRLMELVRFFVKKEVITVYSAITMTRA